MALPQIGVFEDFLAGARVLDHQPESGPSELVQRSASSVHGTGSEVWLGYPAGPLQLESVLAKISDGLRTVGSPSNRAVALAVLALALGTKGSSRLVEHANQLIGDVRPAELLFNLVSPSPKPSADIRADFGTVRVEPFDPSNLEYWAERGHAQWPVAPRDVRGRIAFVSRSRQLVLLHIERMPGRERVRRNWAGRVEDLVDPYYQAV